MRGRVIAFLLALAAPAAAAQAAVPQAEPLAADISIMRLRIDGVETPERLTWSGYFDGEFDREWVNLITGEDMPAALRSRPLSTESYVGISVDGNGRAAGCKVLKASSEPILDRLACDLLTRRGRFIARYETPTRSVPAMWVMAIRWEVVGAAVHAEREARRAAATAKLTPPRFDADPEHRGWPRMKWWHQLTLTALPSIQPAYPAGAGRPEEGVVGLDLVVRPGVGVAACEIGASSGNRVLDEAACAVARTLDLRYTTPCEGCGDMRVPLQVVWRRKGSHIRLPLAPDAGYSRRDPVPRDPADSRSPGAYVRHATPGAFEIRARDFAGLKDRSRSNNRFEARLALDSRGKVTECATLRSTGNSALDQRTCAILASRLNYTPRTDIFGDPAAGTATVRVDLGQMP